MGKVQTEIKDIFRFIAYPCDVFTVSKDDKTGKKEHDHGKDPVIRSENQMK